MWKRSVAIFGDSARHTLTCVKAMKKGIILRNAIITLAIAISLASCRTVQSTIKLRAEVYYPVFDGLLKEHIPVRLMLRFPSIIGAQFESGQSVRIAFKTISPEMNIDSLSLLPLNARTRTPYLEGKVIGLSEDGTEVHVKIEKTPCDSLSGPGLEYDQNLRKYLWLSIAIESKGKAIIMGCSSAGTEMNAPLVIK